MISPMSKAMDRTRMMVASVEDATIRNPTLTADALTTGDALGMLGQHRNDAAYKERYSLFRGVLYSAVNALATEASSQPVRMGRKVKDVEDVRRPITMSKSVEHGNIEVVESHPILDLLENPNPMQARWQFVYSFIANLCLTGWSYIIAGESATGRLELYSLPTTWVHPIHDNGPFSSFRIRNPNNPTHCADGVVLERHQVAFAYLPNPSDPLAATAPASSQMMAIRADDQIWASREQFFHNGIFPGAIVTIGKDPHPDVPSGVRPRLNAPQRRQVYAAVKKVMSGVANYGNPAIVDGLIEKIERLSATTNEMGWEKSEVSTKNAILSAFCVHPYILGEVVGVGGYAQVASIERRFVKRYNVYLDMLSNCVTNFVGTTTQDPNLCVWWEPGVAEDDDLKWRNVWSARTNKDITRSEVRAMMNLPPLDEVEPLVSMEMVPNIVAVLGQVGFGSIMPEQATALLTNMGLPADVAAEIAGNGVLATTPMGQPAEELAAATADFKQALAQFKDGSGDPILLEDLG